MRKVVIISTVIILASCSNVSTEHSNGGTISHDTAFKGAIITDSAGSGKINADTSGMSEAR